MDRTQKAEAVKGLNGLFADAGAVIVAAGLLCGAMDITAAFITWVPKGVSPRRLLQGIASGLLGPAAFRGGLPTTALGLTLHFLIAFTAAAVFYAASRRIGALLHPHGSRASGMRWW